MCLRSVFVAALILAGLLAVQPVGLPSASAQSCSDIEVIFARGTDDTPGLGEVGTAFVSSLRDQVGERTVTAYPVSYPASYDFLASADGAVDASSRMAYLHKMCPSTKVVLGGYSQGAAVVDMLINIPPLGNKIGAIGDKLSIGSAAPLSSDLASQVAAVAVFGNPAAKFSNPATSAPAPFGGRAIDLCKDGDPVCSRGRNPFAHNDYVSTGLTDQAAGFVAGLV